MPLFIEIPHTRQQQIVQRNHSDEYPALILDNGHSRETGLSHTKNDHAQRLVRMRNHGFAYYMPQ
jgi:hypothetical protein